SKRPPAFGSGVGLGTGVGSGDGDGVGLAVGDGVGVAVGVAVGVGVGVGVPLPIWKSEPLALSEFSKPPPVIEVPINFCAVPFVFVDVVPRTSDPTAEFILSIDNLSFMTLPEIEPASAGPISSWFGVPVASVVIRP